MSEIAVGTTELSAGYTGAPVLRDVTFSVPLGATLGVLGPNGSGKTTLIRTLSGELEPASGHFELTGEAGLVPQDARTRNDFPVTALQVALMGSYARTPWYRRLSAAERNGALQALERVGLAELASAQFATLSGGQRQRVLLARALVQERKVMLLDEPFSGVDGTSQQLILKLLRELADNGCTTLTTTHDLDQARQWDYVLCLNGDQIAFGPPAQTLTPEVLKQTYGDEIVILDDGRVAATHHHHGHSDG